MEKLIYLIKKEPTSHRKVSALVDCNLEVLVSNANTPVKNPLEFAIFFLEPLVPLHK